MLTNVQFNVPEGAQVLELGGGDRPTFRPNLDCRSGPSVDIVADLNGDLGLDAGRYDLIFSQYALEHVGWRNVRALLRQVIDALKPGGKFVALVPDTERQVKYVLRRGWEDRERPREGMGAFEEASCCLFGNQDYPENSHRCYFSHELMGGLLRDAGFGFVNIQPYGEFQTDMIIQADKPAETRNNRTVPNGPPANNHPMPDNRPPANNSLTLPAEEVFDFHYFDGGKKVGGYAHEGYRDFLCHEVTARHVLARKPQSVIELGCARGYVIKKLEDVGVDVTGLEVSRHCHLTRACNWVVNHDLCRTPWPVPGIAEAASDDVLCFSVAVLEHVPEDKLPAVIREMARTTHRGLHGIDFGHNDDGFDKTHVTLKSREWWLEQFARHAPGYPVEVLDKEELERGIDLPEEFFKGDGKVKINAGSFTTMFYHGWENIDVHDLAGWAAHNRYKYRRHDVRQGLPYGTSSVDAVVAQHMLEHLTRDEGRAFLRECRRVLRPGGVVRLGVPNASLLADKLCRKEMAYFDQLGPGVCNAPDDAAKFWELLHAGHSSCYDHQSLAKALEEAGFEAHSVGFRDWVDGNELSKRVIAETLDMVPCLSAYAVGIVPAK